MKKYIITVIVLLFCCSAFAFPPQPKPTLTSVGGQASSATLTSLAGLTETNGGIPYGTSDDSYAWLGAGSEGTLLMGNGAAPPSWLSAGTATYFLVAAGAADPVWTDPSSLTIGTSSACTAVDTDDEIIAIINASPSTQIGVPAGGMGAGTFTDHGVLVGSGTGAVTALSVGTAKQVLKGVTGDDPVFATEREFSTQNHTATGNITEAQILASKWHTNNGASAEVDLTLPALSYTVSFVFIVQEAFISEINPPSGELFDHDGTDLDADDCIDLSIVVGDKISFTRMLLADGTTWRWSTDTIRGVHTDTGASD